ncbi:Ger(x)C family spore germination protein [Bacillus cereus]|uniref:Ger(x)C family spore germination protein n=1 Tax=Bacillus cereus TaxID=1396 RepID=UPI000BF5B326|nr:Ger(x)C family spore germination protein [Bacillus cereus]PEQ66069.1 spore gernimation protein [Bacillus cereus]
MKWLIQTSLCLMVLIMSASSCEKSLNMEDVTFTLALGIDLNSQGELIFYTTSPSFGKNVKVKSETFTTKSKTARQSRLEVDKRSLGLTLGSKLQVLLLGKRLLRDAKWFSILDVLYRDSKSTTSPIVIIIDGPVSKIIHDSPASKPRMELFLKSLISTAKLRGETVGTTVQELHRQMYEKGITPYLPRIKRKNQVIIAGSSLLNEKGRYTVSLTSHETTLLQILQNKKLDYSLTLPIFKNSKSHTAVKNMISFNVQDVGTKIYTNYAHGKFQFKFHINLQILISEQLSPFKIGQDNVEFNQLIQRQLQVQFQNLIKKIKKNKLDPVGLGLHARAYQYLEYKQIENKWGEALSKADINIIVNSRIKTMGVIK